MLPAVSRTFGTRTHSRKLAVRPRDHQTTNPLTRTAEKSWKNCVTGDRTNPGAISLKAEISAREIDRPSEFGLRPHHRSLSLNANENALVGGRSQLSGRTNCALKGHWPEFVCRALP